MAYTEPNTATEHAPRAAGGPSAQSLPRVGDLLRWKPFLIRIHSHRNQALPLSTAGMDGWVRETADKPAWRTQRDCLRPDPTKSMAATKMVFKNFFFHFLNYFKNKE